jgi:MFS family permease
LNAVRNLVVICLAAAGWSFSFGVGSQLVSHWMQDHGADNTQIGLNHACHYLGLALASLAVPWINRRVGVRGAAAAMLVCGPTLALFPWSGGPPGWFTLRLLNGAASAISLVPLEALISRDSKLTERARNFAFYGVALTVGGAIGLGTGLNLYVPGDPWTFALGGAAPFLGGLCLFRWLQAGEMKASDPVGRLPLEGPRHFLSFGTAWSQGFLEGGMLAFLALYLEWRGLTTSVAGDLMGITTIGVIVFQVPLSWLADRFGRLLILLACYAITMAGLAAIPYAPPLVTLACCLFAFGACSGAMYPLGLALLGEGLPDSCLPKAYARYLALECAGSVMGAAAMGWARDVWGQGSMFAVGLLGLGAVLSVWAVVQARWRKAKPVADEKRAAA